MLKFLIRAIPHWFNFTPKPDIIPPIPPGQRPYIGVISATNAICTLSHLIFSPPAAGEATRGYVHGGWLIDFVGQTSPVSRWRLLSFDLVCLALQILMMAVTLEKHRVTGARDPLGADNVTRQDLDAEEAGLLRSNDTFEMQDLRSGTVSGSTPDVGVSNVHGATAAQQNETSMTGHPSDSFYTGEHVVANLHIPAIVRKQWKISASVAQSSSTSGVQTAASLAGRRLTLSFGGRSRNDP